MYKMIVSDLDGTLLKNDKTISNKNIKLINEAVNRGIKFVIAAVFDAILNSESILLIASLIPNFNFSGL